MLKPAGTLSLAIGSLSTAAASGGAATGASLAAASPSGRPIRGEPGGSAGAAAGAAPAAGAVACCAEAANVNAPKKAPASNRLRDADRLIVMMVLPCAEALSSRGSWRERARPGADGFPAGTLRYFSVRTQSETCWQTSGMRDDDNTSGTE